MDRRLLHQRSRERKHDIYWATIALRDCGTARCIPALKATLHYPMQDVKCTSILTIAHIAGTAETDLYAEALLGPGYREKGYAMWAICDAADARAVGPVISYFRKNLTKIRAGKLNNATLPDGLAYLHRFLETHSDVNELFAEIKRCWGKLAEGERKTIAERVPYFRDTGEPNGAPPEN